MVLAYGALTVAYAVVAWYCLDGFWRLAGAAVFYGLMFISIDQRLEKKRASERTRVVEIARQGLRDLSPDSL